MRGDITLICSQVPIGEIMKKNIKTNWHRILEPRERTLITMIGRSQGALFYDRAPIIKGRRDYLHATVIIRLKNLGIVRPEAYTIFLTEKGRAVYRDFIS